MTFQFPSGFFWGSATSAHQVEGGNHNDWSEWEEKNADSKAQIAKLNPPAGNWPDYISENFPSPFQKENYISGQASDHYNRSSEDFDIAKSLNQNAHRFSIEWSRIEPQEGKFDEKEIEHYRQVIESLKQRGMEPFVTIWHWTLPLWLKEKKGVLNKKFPQIFSRYAEKIVSEFHNDVRFLTTINEPEIYALNSYYRGRWTPQKRGLISFQRAFNQLIRAHQLAYQNIKSNYPETHLGIVCNLSDFKTSEGLTNVFLKILIERFWNHRFLRRIKNEIDFIGLNFYFHNRINYGLNKNKNETVSDVGWDLHPGAIENVLRDLKIYNKPVYVTESGLADALDKHRAWFIKETLNGIHKALDNGIDVRGYFHWSLLDNFEWDKGFWPRFGLVEIDYKTLERKIRPSALEYAKICKENKIAFD